MVISSGSVEYIYVPVSGPVDPTSLPVDMALVPQGGPSPGSSDWQTAAWRSPTPGAPQEVACLRTPGVWGDGEWLCWVRLHSIPEVVERPAGRVRIGDTRGQPT